MAQCQTKEATTSVRYVSKFLITPLATLIAVCLQHLSHTHTHTHTPQPARDVATPCEEGGEG